MYSKLLLKAKEATATTITYLEDLIPTEDQLKTKAILYSTLALVFVLIPYMFYMSHQRVQFTILEAGINIQHSEVSSSNSEIPADLAGSTKIVKPELNKLISGLTVLAVNTTMINKELESPAGWIPNDKILPTMSLDNNSNFQMGIREVYLRTVQMLRENLSRQDRTNSPIDPDIDKAYGYISVRAESWIFPSYESQLRNSIESLNNYGANLKSGKAGFYPRADTLVKVLENYASLLGSVSNTLNNDSINWFNQDDRFYFAKGVAYAMYENLIAMDADFSKTLNKNTGQKMMDSIIQDMQSSYFEPTVVMTGDIDSWRNNHLDRMARKILTARQKMNSLSSILLHRGSPSGG